MGTGFLDAMGSLGGGSDYSLDEIKQAEKLCKKNGGTLVENLIKVTGRSPSPTLMADPDALMKQMSSIQEMTEALGRRSTAAADSLDAVGKQLAGNQEMLSQEIRELNRNLAQDFGVGSTAAAQTESVSAPSKTQTAQELSGEAALDAFTGIDEEVEQEVFGQSACIKKLIIAFKRPFVIPPGEKRARNTIYLTGPEDTGKHLALEALTKKLKERKILRNDGIRTMDLSLYADATMENVFLQDMYGALAGEEEVIVFTGFENCHPSFLTRISALVTQGSFALPGRYVMQKGQLVNVQNSLASNAVGELTAAGKYLVFLTVKPLDKAAGVMGAAFVDALKGDVCVTQELTEDAILKISEAELKTLKEKAAAQCFFELSFTDDLASFGASRAGRQAGVSGVKRFYESVLEALAQARLEGDLPKGTALKLCVEEGRLAAYKVAIQTDGDSGEGNSPAADREEEKIDLSAYLPEAYRGEVDEIRKEMDEIVGLSEVKQYVLGLEEFYRVQKRREEEGLKTGSVSKHMIFTGSPGTGKTTIARIISRYLKAIGVLSGGQLVEVSRADLVGRYVGHTAPLTNQVIQSAIGGVLFIDEAYSLYRGRDDSYGLEAIDTLVKGIEDNRDNLIVILAGYSHEMAEFLTANSGLKSRFPNVIHFPDYTGEELLSISRSIARSKGYVIDPGADEALKTYFDGVQAVRAADAGNGRLARNLVEDAILNQSRRLVAEPEAELSVLLLKDFSVGEDKEQ